MDPFIGTTGDGNTFPGADVPFGMVQWSPDTTAGGITRPGGYNHGDLIVRGFSLTHLSGAGCVAFGDIPLMPTNRPIRTPPLPNGSPYSDRFVRSSERASPGSYQVTLASRIGVNLTVTQRTGIGTFRYPAGPEELLINAGGTAGAFTGIDGPTASQVRIVGRNAIVGSSSGGNFCHLHNRYTVYFAAQFDRPFASFGTWRGGEIRPGTRQAKGPRAGAYLRFQAARQRVVRIKVGISYVSTQGALRNLRVEDPGWNVDAVRRAARAAWNRMLGRVRTTGGTGSQRTIFYTALYHSLLYPSVFGDVDGQYIGFDRRIHRAHGYTQYANFSGWDIYRSEVPLLAWLVPRQTSDMMQSLVADAAQGGWLPKWPVANDYTGEMDGDSADPIIAGAYAFGARHFAARQALSSMIHGATSLPRINAPYIERPGLSDYLRLGYVRPHTGEWGPAAETLEYGLDDYAIAQLAGALHDSHAASFRRRSNAWRHLFNPITGYVEPRLADGRFPFGFSATSSDGFVEGNAAQYTWLVPHNLPGLFKDMGGTDRAARRLDRFFLQLNAGENCPHYWAGNEVTVGVPWEYDVAGRPWRTQSVVRRIITHLYSSTSDGLPGNDDLGALSSWYVWAGLGLYPEIPGAAGLAVGSPLFSRVTISTGSGRLQIIADDASANHPYVRALTLDRRPYQSSWLPLANLAGDHTLHFSLGSKQTTWGRG